MAALISRDPAVGAGVLKTVNAPCMGLTRKIIKIEQAVMLLGLDSVMNIINAVLLQTAFSEQLDPALLKDFWQSANDSAVAASLLAMRFNTVRADEAFALGLFHNCAMPLILEKHSNYLNIMKIAYSDPQARITQVEDHNFKADHAIIGSYIARAWHLPDEIGTAIRDHHNRERFQFTSETEEEQKIDNLCAILKMAEHTVEEYSTIGGQQEDFEWQLLKDNIFQQFAISEDEFLSLSEDVLQQVHDADLIY